MRTYVIAGTYQQCKEYIHQNKLNSFEVTFVSDPSVLIGTENPNVAYIGTWKDRPDAMAIVEMVKQRTR